MFRVWICLSLLYAATPFLQSSASSDGVMLTCNETVVVEAGKTLTVNCFVRYNDLPDCRILSAQLNPNVTHHYEIKGNTSVLLIVSNVTKDDNWTVEVATDCGLAKPFHIKVTVIPHFSLTDPERSVQHNWHTIAPIIFFVCLFLAAGLFCLLFLFGTDRGRKIIKLERREKIHGGFTHPDS